ncbi:MAG: hypothetical protein ACRYFW_14980 [Janthinobacterium lividum]
MTLDLHDDGERLRAAVEEQLDLLWRARAIAVAGIGRLAAEQAAVGYHPNHLGYLFGGDYASRGMGAAHMLPLVGWHRLPFETAIDRLKEAGVDHAADGDLLTAVRIACETDQELEAAGFAWLGEVGLLKHGAVDRYWLKKPTLGLGQPARMHGLVREHHDGHRGLYALDLADLRARFSDAAAGAPDTSYGGLLGSVVATGGPVLAALGTAAMHQDAEARYEADALSFAAHQRSTARRDWRGKPSLSAQGHLARRTADARDLALPTERTRGAAADWLDANGANVRFRED